MWWRRLALTFGEGGGVRAAVNSDIIRITTRERGLEMCQICNRNIAVTTRERSGYFVR